MAASNGSSTPASPGRRRATLGWALGSLCGAARPVHAATPAVTVFGDDNYAPVIHQSQDHAAGFLAELLQRVEADGLARFELQLVPWKRAYVSAERGEGGLIGVSWTRERDAIFDFSRPVYDDDIRVIVLRGREFPFKGLGDLRGKRIGGVTGASYGDAVDTAIRQGSFTVERDIGQTGRLRKLLAGRLDAAFIGNGERGLAWVLASHPELAQQRDRFVMLPVPLTHDPLHLAFAKRMRMSAFIERFDSVTARLGLQVTPPALKPS